jgi:hypothetical protein
MALCFIGTAVVFPSPPSPMRPPTFLLLPPCTGCVLLPQIRCMGRQVLTADVCLFRIMLEGHPVLRLAHVSNKAVPDSRWPLW